MSDGLDRVVALKKQCTFSNSIKTTQNNVFVSYFIKLYEYWGNFQSSYETKKSMEKIMRLMLKQVIMSDRHVGWTDVFIFATFFSTEKISLN